MRNENAIPFLEKYMDMGGNISKEGWENLSKNKNAISILEKNRNKIEWFWFSLNRSIFITNEEMKQSREPIKEELIQEALHPRRIAKMLELNGGYHYHTFYKII